MKATSFDSQISDSCHSLSLLSEPPDIRNWFPSYKYESFVLDTLDDLGGSMFRESVSERDGLLVGEPDGEKEQNLSESSKCQDPSMVDSLLSPPLLPEPPHLGNLCSSYVPESPLLDSVECLKESSAKDSEHHKCGIVSKLYSKEEEDKPCNEIASISESSSFLSEPPDIKNWFPNYVYESPELGESERFFLDGSDREDEELVNQDNEHQTRSSYEVVIEGKQRAARFLKDYTSLADVTLGNQSLGKDNKKVQEENSFPWDNLCCERENLEDKAFPSQHISPVIGDRKSSLENGSFPCKEQHKEGFSQEAGSVSFKSSIKPSNCYRKSPTKLVSRKNFVDAVEAKNKTEIDQLSPRNDSKFILDADCSRRKPTHGSNDKENEGKDSSSDVFLTTSKGTITKPATEDSWNRKQENVPVGSRNTGFSYGDVKKNVTAKRKVLSERTNLEHLKPIEVTGKWKCPQKGKPNVGPPLKQLRLERWVHKVYTPEA